MLAGGSRACGGLSRGVDRQVGTWIQEVWLLRSTALEGVFTCIAGGRLEPGGREQTTGRTGDGGSPATCYLSDGLFLLARGFLPSDRRRPSSGDGGTA